jgi:glycosyltransferase A (GT-A) superfamily protein (DUF2064 family)
MLAPRHRAESLEAPRKRAAPFRCRLVVMAKVPVAGTVKTRLARELGLAAATRFARQSTAALLQRLARDPRWQTTLAVSPDMSIVSHAWPDGITRVGQGRGDLGRRMQRIMERKPRGPAVIIGTDIPGITPAHVFGPADDGGYWLVGLKRRPQLPRPFTRVRWSSPHALADTLANLEGTTVAFVATLSDIDDARAFGSVATDFGRRVLPVRLSCPIPPGPLA